LQFSHKVYLITSKARITAFVISAPGVVSSSPTIAYLFACLLIKLCQLSICLPFLQNGLTLKEAGLISIDAGLISMEAGLISIEDGLISMEAGLISIETSGEHDVIFQD
jgi:hypothetical protein